MNVCPPPEPPDYGEMISTAVAESPSPTFMQARKCRDGSWVVNAFDKSGKVVDSLVIPPPDHPTAKRTR